VAVNNAQCDRYWHHWCTFLWPSFDPHLCGRTPEERISLLQAFAEWARQGRLGRGHQVRASTVQAALSAIGKSFELDGYDNPLFLKHTNQLHPRIDRQLESYRRSDPPTRPQLAVPVAVPNWVYLASRQSQRPQIRAIGELCLLAFYFLLRVGEYTQPKAGRSTRTQQFRLQDVLFFVNKQPISFAQLRQNPNLPDMVRLRIDNQKNGRCGQIIAHRAIPLICCPVKACVARVLALLDDNASPDTLICAYRPHPQAPVMHVTNDDIIRAVRASIPHLSHRLKGYKPKIVGTHSLRSGGAMALFLSGFTPEAIMKMGRWTSTTFMTYIHEQIDTLSQDAAAKMSQDVPFANLDVSPPSP